MHKYTYLVWMYFLTKPRHTCRFGIMKMFGAGIFGGRHRMPLGLEFVAKVGAKFSVYSQGWRVGVRPQRCVRIGLGGIRFDVDLQKEAT